MGERFEEYSLKPNNPRQEAFIKSDADYLFFGGARGGSKTWSLSYDAALHVRKVIRHEDKGLLVDKEVLFSIDYPEYRALILRRTYPMIKTVLEVCKPIYTILGAKFNKKDMTFTFPSGAMIQLGNCNEEDDVDKYIGGNYHYLGIDEANQFPWVMIEKLLGSIRSTNPELKTFVRLCSNPGGVGHIWLKEKFVDKCPPITLGEAVHKDTGLVYPIKVEGKMFTTNVGDTKETWQFIPSLVFDNPAIIENDKKFVPKLLAQPEAIRKMWIYGDFGAYTGQWLDIWCEDYHVIKNENFVFGKEAVNKTFVTHKTHNFYLGLDYGTKAPFACLFFAVDYEGNVILFDEIVETGLTAKQQAEYIKQYAWEEYRIDVTKDIVNAVADPSYWNKKDRGGEGFRSDADYYEDCGIPIIKGNNDRVQTAKIVYEFFRIKENGQPSLKIVEKCEYSIKTIPSLPPDDKNPEDVDTNGEDHSFDALKYFLSVIPITPEKIFRKETNFIDKLLKKYTNSSQYLDKEWRAV